MADTMRYTRLGAAVLLAAAIALAGCQASDDDADPTDKPASSDKPLPTDGTPSLDPTEEPSSDPGDGPAPGQAEVDLVVTVDPTGEGATTTYTLTCLPTGGHHPDAEAACATIAAGGDGVDVFAPVPRDVACTEIWGGPQTATVTGVVGGERVDARFDRHNGCEIARWDSLAALFGPDTGLQ